MVGKREPTQFGFLNPPPPESDSPIDRLLQRVDELVDFEPVREMAAPYFADIGRPSIDPILMIKMMIAGYLLGICSDRMLVIECADRISVRRFLGLGLTDRLPAHSSFTHWRQRLGTQFFRSLLHYIVSECESQGLTLSGDRTVDGTAVKAQADRHGPVVEVPEGQDVDSYLQQLAADDPENDDDGSPPETEDGDDPPPDDSRKTTSVNTHDSDARMNCRFPSDIAEFRYYVSFCADAHTGLITDALAYAREWATTAAEHIAHEADKVKRLVADGLYDDGKSLAELLELGVQPHVPETTHKRHGQLSRDEFTYDPDRDVYICPEGNILKCSRYREATGQSFYVALKSDCDVCPRKAECTTAPRRTVTRQDYEWARERTVRAGPDYDLLQRRRRINEHLNLMAKRDHAMSRARSLGRDAICVQAALTAVAINLRKLVGFADRSGRFAAIIALICLLAALRRRSAPASAHRSHLKANQCSVTDIYPAAISTAMPHVGGAF